MTQYLVIYEHDVEGWSAYVPDLPGCVSVGEDQADAERNIREAIALHLVGLRADGMHVPPATTSAGIVTA